MVLFFHSFASRLPSLPSFQRCRRTRWLVWLVLSSTSRDGWVPFAPPPSPHLAPLPPPPPPPWLPQPPPPTPLVSLPASRTSLIRPWSSPTLHPHHHQLRPTPPSPLVPPHRHAHPRPPPPPPPPCPPYPIRPEELGRSVHGAELRLEVHESPHSSGGQADVGCGHALGREVPGTPVAQALPLVAPRSPYRHR